MKSVKVLRLFSIRPSSCQRLPSSPPPRMWAIATVDAAVEQAQPVRREADRVRDAVGAVAGQQERARAVALRSRAADEGDRDASCRRRPWRRCAPSVARRIVAAEHLGLLEQHQLRVAPRRVVHRRRRDQGLVAEAIAAAAKSRWRRPTRRRARGTRRGARRPSPRVGDPSRSRPSSRSWTTSGRRRIQVLEHHVVAMGDQLRPALRRADRRRARGRDGSSRPPSLVRM